MCLCSAGTTEWLKIRFSPELRFTDIEGERWSAVELKVVRFPGLELRANDSVRRCHMKLEFERI